ncbi:uncharacterized protein LOC120490596 [Pimephales promelas]|uniref:uncharacterized protein LOC120490596 n=1 Tax=Pimephales promelas TaxID=90988 RepID=UPI001955513C|nr:uncharacterized protein LOC120490596 [Pimephales promelas]
MDTLQDGVFPRLSSSSHARLSLLLFPRVIRGRNIVSIVADLISATFDHCAEQRKREEFKVAFGEVWNSSETESTLHNLDADEHLSYFNSTCASILNSIAPLKLKFRKSVPIPWLNESVRFLRQACRQAERKWKKDKLQVSYEIMRDSLFTFQRAAKAAKCKYLSDLIKKNRHNSRVLFSTIDSVLNPPVTFFPEPSVSLCESFGNFFTNKVLDIRSQMAQTGYTLLEIPLYSSTWSEFEPLNLHS